MLVTGMRRVSPGFKRHYEKQSEIKRIEKTSLYRQAYEAEIQRALSEDDYRERKSCHRPK